MQNLLSKDKGVLTDLAKKYPSIEAVYQIHHKSKAKYWFMGTSILAAIVLFLPWTQNIRADGKVTTMKQENRPQELNTLIPGRIVKWYVSEGDFVEKGDTLLQLAEVKTEYLDPALTQNYSNQIEAKKLSSVAYLNKANAAENQIALLKESMRLKLDINNNKLEQQTLKISSDSLDLKAAENAYNAYNRQIEAAQSMLEKGALSLIEFEKRKVTFQDAKAKVNSASNKLNQSKQEFLSLKIDRNAIAQEYLEKIAKSDGDKFSSISDARSTEAEVNKLKNQLANYSGRQDMLYVLAPQKGQLVKAKKAGIGEVLKEGEILAEIVPDSKEKAVELFIKPMDLPLLSKGQQVRFIFDGFPAIVFSGWPENSYGTFAGKVSAIETNPNEKGLFRVLVSPDGNWPDYLQLGGGARGIALLKNVPIYYELWRNINGFPPEYYQYNSNEKNTKK
jgi:multidrug efflux pump subunit AcrA (membrane-fusion protein)